MYIPGKLFPDQRDHGVDDGVRLIAPDKKEVPAGLAQRDALSAVDPVGVDGDIALRRLAENAGQLHHRKAA